MITHFNMMYPFNEIKEHYKRLTPLIFAKSEENVSRWVSPYCGIDWMSMFSPIEVQTWYAIRQFGRAPMYPQYPVGKYFVDFGNPAAKVAIECDGKEWHKDIIKEDKYRDDILKEYGWDVYRISGSDCLKIYDEDEVEPYYIKTIEGLIKSVSFFYFGHKIKYDEVNMAHQCVRNRISVWDEEYNEFIDKFSIRYLHH